MSCVTPTLLIIGYVWPEPNSSAAGTRMLQLIKQFLTHGYGVHFASPAKLGEHKADLTSLGVQEYNIELNHSSFDLFIAALQPNLVLFDRFMMEEQFGWRVAQYAPNALRILNTEDLHCLREVRQQLVKSYLTSSKSNGACTLDEIALHDVAVLKAKLQQTDLAKREIAAIFRSDLTLMISEFEMDLLVNHFNVPITHLHYLPFLYEQDAGGLPAAWVPTFAQRIGFVSIGNFRHAPNWDAVLWLKQQIWPHIRKQLPQAECFIYGAYPPKKATELHNPKQGFYVKGWVDDAFAALSQARVCLAPLRFGAGIKGKLAEAMLCGTPSVTTSIGAESMLLTTWPGHIANNDEAFARLAVQLHQDDQAWLSAQTVGFDTVAQRYQMPRPEISSLFDTLKRINQQLDAHRSSNFMGSVLNHHHHKSTQYMAQWIEVKNQLAQANAPINPIQQAIL
ncbi:glycosyltransferase [Thiomicrorhabdus aquaedulcis]|uniref:glycosyltransferase n=1 Tax=Thiomicrorhabdus aquaedulcis TaxID=2211106 RepID=UPI000FD7814C|nr:glycosyltransferase [Thiomicrorhabdus aquaedulcis]